MVTTATETPQDKFTATLEAPDLVARPTPNEAAGGAAPLLRREPAINAMFRRMCELKAADLHMSASVAPLVRKDGEMRRLHETAVVRHDSHAPQRDHARHQPGGV
jgi:hypothetical protein